MANGGLGDQLNSANQAAESLGRTIDANTQGFIQASDQIADIANSQRELNRLVSEGNRSQEGMLDSITRYNSQLRQTARVHESINRILGRRPEESGALRGAALTRASRVHDEAAKQLGSLGSRLEDFQDAIEDATNGIGKFQAKMQTAKVSGAMMKQLWRGIKSRDRTSIQGTGRAISALGERVSTRMGGSAFGRAAGGAMMRGGSMIASRAATLAGPVGWGILAAGMLAKMSSALNEMRTANVNSYFEVGGPNVRSNTLDQKGGVNQFNARQYAYNAYRYNHAIKYGMDAEQMHNEVFSQYANTGLSTEGLMKMQNKEARDRGNVQGSLLSDRTSTAYKGASLVKEQMAGFEAISRETYAISTALGLSMAEVSADRAKMLQDYGNETNELSKVYGSVAESASKAGVTSRYMLDRVNELSSGFMEMGSYLSGQFSQGLSRTMNLMGGGTNLWAKNFSNVMNPFSSMKGDRGVGRMALMTGSGYYLKEIRNQLAENNKRLKDPKTDASTRIGLLEKNKRLQAASRGDALTMLGMGSKYNRTLDPAEQLKSQLGLLKSLGVTQKDIEEGSYKVDALASAIGFDEDQIDSFSQISNALTTMIDDSGSNTKGVFSNAFKGINNIETNDEFMELLSSPAMEGISDTQRKLALSLGVSGMKKYLGGASKEDLVTDVMTNNKSNYDLAVSAGDNLSSDQLEAMNMERTSLSKMMGFTADQVKFFSSESSIQKVMSGTMIGIYNVAQKILTAILSPASYDKITEVETITSRIGDYQKELMASNKEYISTSDFIAKMEKIGFGPSAARDMAAQADKAGTGQIRVQDLVQESSKNVLTKKKGEGGGIVQSQSQMTAEQIDESAANFKDSAASMLEAATTLKEEKPKVANTQTAGTPWYNNVQGFATGGIVRNPNGSSSSADRILTALSPGEAVLSRPDLLTAISNGSRISQIANFVASLGASFSSIPGASQNSTSSNDKSIEINFTINAPTGNADEISKKIEQVLEKFQAKNAYEMRLKQNVRG